MERFYILLILILLMFIEAIKNLLSLFRLSKEQDFALEFVNNLTEYVNSRGSDEVFIRLSTKAARLQNYMGDYGIVTYQPPFATHYINNYQIILNGIDEIKKEMQMGYGDSQHFHMVRDTILKYTGQVEISREDIISTFKNPLRLFAASIRTVLMIPFKILYEVGILNSQLMSWMKTNYLMQFVSGVVAILSLLSAAMTIMFGWSQFVSIISGVFTRIF